LGKELAVSRLYVRHRRHVGKGTGRPRFAIVASHGVDLRVYKTRVRRAELERIAADLPAEIVYLPRGEEREQGTGRCQDERPER
jgi:hypothetical protein